MRRSVRLMMASLFVIVATGLVLPGPAHAYDCAALLGASVADTTITAAVVVAATSTVPEYCRVDAYVTTPGDATVAYNTVPFRVGLPTTAWNGRFYFVGVGGYGGQIGSLNSGLMRGYATASTDTGHQTSSNQDARWALNNVPKIIDYGYRGTHVSTVAAKAIAAIYYGAAPQYSYFVGCSNGGRMALTAAQRYPEDFDGIVAGDPSFGTLGQINRVWGYQSLLSDTDHYIPKTKLDLIANAVLAQCDALDGLADGLIDDPRRCSFDPAVLQCPAGDEPTCLTAGQVQTLKKIYAGPRDSAGTQITFGFPVGHENLSTGWQAWIVGGTSPVLQPDGTLAFPDQFPYPYPPSPPPSYGNPSGYNYQAQFVKYLAFETQDPNGDWRTFNFDTDVALLQARSEILSPTNPDLGVFKGLGGKLIIYHGWADPALSAYATVDYRDRVVKAIGNEQKADEFLRLYMVPGMHHCSGGPGPNVFDVVTPLVKWVEQGVPPAEVIASHSTSGVVDRTRPLCPYPQVARYVGTGSIDAAENFVCELKGLDRADQAADFTHGAQGRTNARQK